MAIEKRHSIRHPAETDVYIRYRQKRIFNAKARNVSLHGMLLETSSLILPINHPVELVFNHNGASWSLPATVAHCRKDRLGVVFDTPHPELFELGSVFIFASHKHSELAANI